jgi:DNA-binding NarL/FixJ family response regulator
MIKSASVKVLIVDDNELNARALKRALSRRHEVRTTQTAEEALAMVERDPPDAVVCDFELGQGTSAGFLRLITEQFPSVRRVLYSASRPEQWVQLVAEKLIDIALAKPTSLDQLMAAIERA